MEKENFLQLGLCTKQNTCMFFISFFPKIMELLNNRNGWLKTSRINFKRVNIYR